MAARANEGSVKHLATSIFIFLMPNDKNQKNQPAVVATSAAAAPPGSIPGTGQAAASRPAAAASAAAISAVPVNMMIDEDQEVAATTLDLADDERWINRILPQGLQLTKRFEKKFDVCTELMNLFFFFHIDCKTSSRKFQWIPVTTSHLMAHILNAVENVEQNAMSILLFVTLFLCARIGTPVYCKNVKNLPIVYSKRIAIKPISRVKKPQAINNKVTSVTLLVDHKLSQFPLVPDVLALRQDFHRFLPRLFLQVPLPVKCVLG